MPTKERKAEFVEAAKQHLASVGATNWKDLFKKFPDLHEQTMWRWIRIAKGADVSKPQLINAKARIKKKLAETGPTARDIEAAENGTKRIAQHLPAAPTPNYIARTGEQGMQNIDFVSEIKKLYNDATMLRSYSMVMREDENGEKAEAIKNPNTFERSIIRRASIIETALKAMQEVWDLRTMQNFYETIIDAIGEESPECQRRIMTKLAELNNRHGITMGARF